MRIVLSSSRGVLYSLDVLDDTQISTVISLAKVEAGLPESAVIEIVHNGKVVINQNATLVEVGVHDGDVMQFRSPVALQSVPAIDFGAIKIPVPGTSTSTIRRSAAGGSSSTGEEAMEHRQLDDSNVLAIINKFSGKSQLALLRNENPSLADAIEKNDIGAVRDVVKQQMEEHHQKQKRLIEAYANPFSAESQQIIEEVIQQHNINSLYESAIEHTPEAFGTVTMLYINVKLNGHDVKAFVDCGAQTTILSKACAERCNIMRLVDKRFAGIAKGVGTQKIIGKIHMAQLQVEDHFFQVALTVLEDQSMDMLLGLDMMKRHLCNIDLKSNQLVFSTTGTATPFLHEGELPEFAKLNRPLEAMMDEDAQLAAALQKSADESLKNSATSSSSSSVNSAESPMKAVKLDATGSALAQASGNSAAFAASSAAPAASVSEEKIKKVVAMGFKREDAVAELLRSKGNVNKAVGELLAKQLPSLP